VYRMVDSLVLSRVYWPTAARFNPRLAAGGAEKGRIFLFHSVSTSSAGI
jgi:hypothetical protein